MNRDLFLGEVAQRCGVEIWKIQALYARGLLPPARRIGRYRVVGEGELPTVIEALRRGGYMPCATAAAAPASA